MLLGSSEFGPLCLIRLLIISSFLGGVTCLLPGLYCGEKNCYEVLNITRDNTKTELTKAYRSLAKKWHPDRHKGKEAKALAETEFQLIATAYETLRDDEVRTEYDYLLDNPDELFRHYWYYYRRKAAPNVDIRIVILATILICSIIQYLSASQKYHEAIQYALTHPKYRHQASLIAKDRGLIGEARKKENRKARKTKEEIKAEEEIILKHIIQENIDVKFWIKKEEYGEEEKMYLIRKNLKLSQDQFDAMGEDEHERMMSEELWVKETFAEWKAEREEAERRKMAESGRAKAMRRYMKNNKDTISFVDDDF